MTVLETSKNSHIYLCVVLDIFSKMIVGWSISSRDDTKLIVKATSRAVVLRNPPKGLVIHSDTLTVEPFNEPIIDESPILK